MRFFINKNIFYVPLPKQMWVLDPSLFVYSHVQLPLDVSEHYFIKNSLGVTSNLLYGFTK
jgi:hypothetical protein